MKTDRVQNSGNICTFTSVSIRDRQTMNSIRKRMLSRCDFKIFNRLINGQKSNDRYNIMLGATVYHGRNYLNAEIYDGAHFYLHCKEGFLSSFLSPVFFLKKICNKANMLKKHYDTIVGHN